MLPSSLRWSLRLWWAAPSRVLLVLFVSTGVLVAGRLAYARPSLQEPTSLIVFSNNAEGDHDIYVMQPNGSNVEQLTIDPDVPVADEQPVWSPDQSKIAYASTQNG